MLGRLRTFFHNINGLIEQVAAGSAPTCAPIACPERSGASRVSLGLGAPSGQRERDMRVFFGMILGCTLTIGSAYVFDGARSDPGVRPVVNWDVVSKNWDNFATRARTEWNRIAG